VWGNFYADYAHMAADIEKMLSYRETDLLNNVLSIETTPNSGSVSKECLG